MCMSWPRDPAAPPAGTHCLRMGLYEGPPERTNNLASGYSWHIDDYTHNVDVDADGCYDYVTLKEETELEFAVTDDGYGDADDDYARNIDGYCDPPKEEPEPELSSTDGGGGDRSNDDNYLDNCDPPKQEPVPKLCNSDGDAGDDDACNIDADSYCDYGSPKEEPELGDDDNACNIGSNANYDCDPLKEDPEAKFAATGDDALADDGQDVDIGYDCSYCGVNLCTQEIKVKHELRCKDQMQRRKFESQVTEVYHCVYCRCPFLNKEFKEQHQQKYCPKRPVSKIRDSNGPYFECDTCEFVTKRKDSLERHVLNHNKNKVEWFTCTQCSYKTVHKGYMTKHMKIHVSNHNKKNAEWFTCTQCSYKTTHKRYLTKHTKIHGVTFSCCCPICGKSFRRKACLNEHLLRRHFDESEEVSKLITSKIHTCNICNQYRTTSKTNFNEHVTVTHLKGVGCQKYECSHCSYSTFYKGNLKKHLNIHAGQKAYWCSVCKKEFTRKFLFDSHVLFKHADSVDLMKMITSKIHRCELCPFKTVIKTHLQKHVRLKHT